MKRTEKLGLLLAWAGVGRDLGGVRGEPPSRAETEIQSFSSSSRLDSVQRNEIVRKGKEKKDFPPAWGVDGWMDGEVKSHFLLAGVVRSCDVEFNASENLRTPAFGPRCCLKTSTREEIEANEKMNLGGPGQLKQRTRTSSEAHFFHLSTFGIINP